MSEMPRYAPRSATRERIVGVALGPSGSPCAIATRARAVSAYTGTARRCPTRRRRPSAGRDQIPARQCGLGNVGAHQRRPRGETPVLLGRLGRVPRRSRSPAARAAIPNAATKAAANPAKLGAASRLASAAARPAATSPCRASAAPWCARLTAYRTHREAPRRRRPPRPIVRQLQPDRFGRAVPTPGTCGKGASQIGHRSRRRGRVLPRRPRALAIGSPRRPAAQRLPSRGSAEPPPIVQLPDQSDRLGEVHPASSAL